MNNIIRSAGNPTVDSSRVPNAGDSSTGFSPEISNDQQNVQLHSSFHNSRNAGYYREIFHRLFNDEDRSDVITCYENYVDQQPPPILAGHDLEDVLLNSPTHLYFSVYLATLRYRSRSDNVRSEIDSLAWILFEELATYQECASVTTSRARSLKLVIISNSSSDPNIEHESTVSKIFYVVNRAFLYSSASPHVVSLVTSRHQRKSVLLTDGFPDFVIAVTAALFSVFDLFSHHKENVTKAERRNALCHGYILNLVDEQLKDMYLRLETPEEAVRTSKLPGHVWDVRPERQLELILPMYEYSNEPSLEARNAEVPTGPNEPQEDLRPSSTLSYRPEGEETLLGRISDSMTQVLETEIFLFGNRAILQKFDFDVAHMKDYKDDFSSLFL
ncbi:hypothetical protein B9Z65_3635 [Elsinoe australis]|uniref:Uncharacterized protein n=1 Tax=Elsinoe australis TaxID=40998 RepID=A0A2P8AFU3_9PEZI|nr:hypothetical protein B9Z65_3635 [Elsinoe australis]